MDKDLDPENKADYVMVFEAPKIELPEFRLYYDENTGDVLFYTCEKPEGKYIVIDNITFACARHDVKVVDGKIVFNANKTSAMQKLVVSDNGTKCLKEDLSVVINEETDAEFQYYKLQIITV